MLLLHSMLEGNHDMQLVRNMLEYLDLNTLYRYLSTLRKRHEKLRETRNENTWYQGGTGAGHGLKNIRPWHLMGTGFWRWACMQVRE